MKKRWNRIPAILLALSLITLAACKPAENKDNYQADQTFLYGVNYVDIRMSDRIAVNQASYLSTALGAKSVRICANPMETGATFQEIAKDRLHSLFSALTLSGVEQVILQVGTFPMDGVMGNVAPYPEPDDSEYLRFLDGIEAMAKMLAEEYPEVEYFQLGNLLNYNLFLHPLGWREENSPVDPFTLEEKAHIATDFMHRTMKGVRSAGSDAKIIMPAISATEGFGSTAMTDFLDQIYQNIASGQHGSTEVEVFFDALAWHPVAEGEPDNNWVENNNKLYDVARQHQDQGRKVYLTEFGYDSKGEESTEKMHADWIAKAYELIKSQMPYVESMHYYRLFNDGEEVLGLINEPRAGFAPNAKGLAYQESAGGDQDLSRYVIKEDQYSSGENVALGVLTKASSSCEHPGWGWSLAGINNGTTENAGWSNYYELGEADWVKLPTGEGSNDYNRPEWVEFNFPYAWEIDTVLLYTRNEIDSHFNQLMGVPRWTVVEVSDDGENWTQVGELRVKELKTYPPDVEYLDRSENPPLKISFDSVKTRNVRVVFKQLSTNWQHQENNYFVQLQEIEILMH